MVFAQIKDGIVKNTIVVNDLSLLPLFQTNSVTGQPYDLVLQVDTVYPQPGIGWTFDGIMFNPPEVDDGSGSGLLGGGGLGGLL